MPSPVSMMESTAILKRPTIGRDSQQGVTQDPFVMICPSAPCSVQPASTDVMMLYQQRNTKVNTVVFFAQDIQAQVNDRLTTTNPGGGTKDILVRGYAQQVDRMVVWRLDGWEDPPPARPTAVTFAVDAPSIVAIGTPFNFTVTALDAVGNIVTEYSGAAQFFSFTDPLAILPSPGALTNGVGTFSATMNTFGVQNILAQDTANYSIYGSADIEVEAFGINVWDQVLTDWDLTTTNWNG